MIARDGCDHAVLLSLRMRLSHVTATSRSARVLASLLGSACGVELQQAGENIVTDRVRPAVAVGLFRASAVLAEGFPCAPADGSAYSIA